MGIPILTGYFTNHIPEGKLASLAALVILYIQSNHLPTRMMTLIACSFGILFSFTVGIVFTVSPFIAPLVLGIYTFLVHIALYHLGLSKPPGNFFFVMIATVAICMPFHPETLIANIGYVAIGAMLSCVLGLAYSLVTLQLQQPMPQPTIPPESKEANLVAGLTFGLFTGLSLFIARLLKLENPYWVPTSCIAVMHGASASHVFTRSLQRILGTLIGLGCSWGILLLAPSPLVICILIILSQVIVEFLVVRNYAIAVVFITLLTILLAESNTAIPVNSAALFRTRVIDILLGCSLGSVGGWILYNERVHYQTGRQIRKTKLAWRKRHRD